MDEELAQSLLSAINAQTQTLNKIDYYLNNQNRDASPGPQRSSSYGPSPNFNANDVTGFFGKLLSNTKGDPRVYTDKFIGTLEGAVPSIAGLTQGSAEAARAFVDLVQSNAEARNYLAQFGLDTEGELLRTYELTTALNLNLTEFGNLVSQNSQQLVRLGGSVEGGLSELINLQNMLRQDSEFEGMFQYMRALGMSMQDINQYFLDYLSNEQILGLQDDAERRKRLKDGLEFRANLQALSEATGIAVGDLGQASGSAASIAAQLEFGSTEVMKLAGFAGSQGLTALQTLLETGMLDPNNEQTGYMAAMMPVTTRMAQEFNQIMREGGDISQKQQQEFNVVMQKELQNMTRQYGRVADIAGLSGISSQIRGASGVILGQDLSGAFAEQNQEMSEFAQGIGQATSAITVLNQAQDEYTDATRNARYATIGLVEGFQTAYLTLMRESSEFVGTIAGGMAGLRDKEVEQKLDQTYVALEDIATEMQKIEKEGGDTSALKEEAKRVEELQLLLENTLKYRSGEITTQELETLFQGTSFDSLNAEEIGISLERKILDINIAEIAGRPASAEDFVGFGYTPPDEMDQSIQSEDPAWYLELYKSFSNWFRGGVNSAEFDMKNRVNSNTAQPNDDQASLQNIKQLNENIETLIEVEKANGERMAEIKPALLDFGNKTAGAMGSAAFSLAEQSRTNNLSSSIAKSTGVLTSASA